MGTLLHVPRYLLPFDSRSLAQIFCDVLVVGSGIAGQAAALSAADAGAGRVLLLTKGALAESNTYYAQAGIAAAVGPDDSLEQHVADTVSAGAGLCHEEVVRDIVAAAPQAVEFLAEFGVRFDRDGESALLLGREGGHAVRRVAHALGDATGQEIQRALGEAVHARRGILVREEAMAVELLVVDGRCVGVVALMRGELRIVWASAVVMACGGAAPLFRESTNPAVTTGDGIAMAYRAGVRIRDMEFMQFHPTVLYMPGAGRKLISEAARGEGAVIVDVSGDRFLRRMDPRGELAPRDVVSRGIVTHLLERGESHVLLDLSGIEPDRLRSRLPGVVETGLEVGIDVTQEPLPVRPAAHYTIGGIAADSVGRTSLPGLYAAGEIASNGMHGANRLASNSLLEGAVVGPRAGRAAAQDALAQGEPLPHEVRSRGPGRKVRAVDVADILRSVKSLAWRQAGVRREPDGLRQAEIELAGWAPYVLRRSFGQAAGIEAQNLCILAGLLVESALLREETRGVHWRADHPERRDDAFLGHFEHLRGEPTRFSSRSGATSGGAV